MKNFEKDVNWSNRITVYVFLCLIILPNIVGYWFDLPFDKKSSDMPTYELPRMTVENYREFPELFDDYYNNTLPFRNLFGILWADINYYFLRESANTSVVLGRIDGNDRERWLFYDNKSDYSPIEDVQGLTSFSATQTQRILDRIKNDTNRLRSQGIELYYLFVPSKESIYKEKLPESVELFSDTTRTDMLVEHALTSGVRNIIYPKEELIEEKSLGQLYWKQDTHWNELGAGVVFKSMSENLLDGLSYNFKYHFNKEQVDKDLSEKMMVFKHFEDEVVVIEHDGGSDDFRVNTINGGKDEIVFSNNKNAPIKKTIMIVGDSYRNALRPFFMRMFKNCIFLHRNDYRQDMLVEYDVDIVLSEYVERYVPTVNLYSL